MFYVCKGNNKICFYQIFCKKKHKIRCYLTFVYNYILCFYRF
nr:MAG TPA: hypothetical protein [Caudoviricetes sp.]